MKKPIYIIITFFFVLAGYFSIIRLLEKPDLPFEFDTDNKGVLFDNYPPIAGPHHILSIDGFAISDKFQLEFLLDRRKTGDVVNIVYSSISGTAVSEKVVLTPYYHNPTFPIISGFVGYVFILTGLLVILKKPRSRQAELLYWILVLYGTATLSSPGRYDASGDIAGYILRTMHALCFSGGGLFFVLFILSFPEDKLKNRKTVIIVLSALTLAAAVFASAAQIISIGDISSLGLFEQSWSIVYSLLLASMAYGAVEFIQTFRSVTGREDRRKMEWILWGQSVGVGPYLLLWIVPFVFRLPVLVEEQYSLAFLIFVPVSFAIAVVKYHVMDIEVVVKRSFVYALLSLCIIGIYTALVYLSSVLFAFILGPEVKLLNLIAVLISALSFNPLRNRLNKFADRVFYREKYRFDRALLDFSAGVKEYSHIYPLTLHFIDYIGRLIPVKQIAAVLWSAHGQDTQIIPDLEKDRLRELMSDSDFKGLLLYSTIPLAQPQSITPDIGFVSKANEIMAKHNISVCIPLMLNKKSAIGSVLLGEKLSGLRFSVRDIELIKAIAAAAAAEIERIRLHQMLVAEEIELAKLEELNRLKSFYVASVSHDLKTPLTSIKVFTELMQSDNNIPKAKRDEYLKIIEGESDRLTRLIENVLNYAKIEKGLKQYTFAEADLNAILKTVMNTLEYPLQISKFKTEIKYAPDKVTINADADAVKNVLFNIINNSVKYSADRKCIRIITGVHDSRAYIEIEDSGIGIPEADQKAIFDPFFRSVENSIKGAGLGLAIVKHVMDAHKGTIELYSKVNFGTKIRLNFPLIENE